ncbi:hypothetical protein [Tenacibaculum finnmarkense]|uniref:hypothetical protein n=1 Tax=Tenacibaculum finnmarkense TaxID=2781243 RepID=UPI001EFBFC53|nr:hypothetical protein [Tenacibaculum finnmarkense]MCG8249216.1 hypothetical protein [Tenacibaculum finnmarkense genomovar finnmarkense]MCG8729515.1 hypothetical protein [Tenacibaculum finnmarkense]MCG8734166.1 hypothetical protein [Tenacibaculum finnmarkense]MCG8740984.1 hypothetical protein [Tenacibaculum finnmarkense]MCG8746999.1 hypothetical protein [Tenacibaculum finnmarkense]
MPPKNPIAYASRREFILSKIDELLKDSSNFVFSVFDAKLFIAENLLFVDVRSIDRMLKDDDVSSCKPLLVSEILKEQFVLF